MAEEVCARCGHAQAYHWDDDQPCSCYRLVEVGGRQLEFCGCAQFVFLGDDDGA